MTGDVWSYIGGLREDLGRAEERIRELEDRYADVEARYNALDARVKALESQTPQAQQLQYEADLAAADAADWDGGWKP